MSRLSAHEEPLSKIFSAQYQFSIPDYQRPYSWTTEQSLQLLEDLTNALDRESKSEPYFLGSIVLVKNIDDSAAEVIDGQQRLTTVTMLLAVLRSLTESAGLRTSFEAMISEPGDELLERLEQPRLRLRSRDREFYRHYVQDGHLSDLFALPDGSLKTDAQRNIRDNAKAIYDELATWTDARRTEFSRLLGNRTFLVAVATTDLVSAHRIFNVMNSRGLDLSAADIFKSRVIGALPKAESELYATKWEDAEDGLGRQAFQDLFLHIRTIYAKTRAQKEILQEFPVQVLDQFLPDRAAAFVDEVLLPYADAYATIENESYVWPHGATEVNAWLRRLNQIDNNDWKPVALWLLHNFKTDPARLAAMLMKLERIASIMLIRRAYQTPRSTRYANLLKSLDAGYGTDAPEFAVSDQDKRSALLQLVGPIYDMAPVRRYVLLRLNELLASAPVTFNPKIVTVEHVLPQTPRHDSKWMHDFSDEDREYWVHRLANLVLLDKKKNSEAQNYDFDEKKKRYFRSTTGITPFALTMGVIDSPSWTPELLETRQTQLVETLAKAWDIGRDSSGMNLARLSENELASTNEPSRGSSPVDRRVTLVALLAAGLLEADTRLVWKRPRVGEVHQASVTAQGQILLEDGRLFDTPSRAAKEAAGIEAQDGWDAWALPDGRKIGALWHEYQVLKQGGYADNPKAAVGTS
ncbi:GmrSD restriction endonuclease domain-containing protein [Arthrobacter sp. D3-16]